MKLGFVSTVKTAAIKGDVNDNHKALPRPLRKALRVVTVKAKAQVHDGVDSYLHTEYRIDKYHIQNLEFLDRGYDFDEFQDIDDEFESLSVFEPLNEIELFQFLTGYDII
jgi:hypothetical protein